MKLLIDMNLSPALTSLIRSGGHEVLRWADQGAPDAEDAEILGCARENGYVLLSHDLDFESILAATNAQSPSVIQIRTQNVAPKHIAPLILPTLNQCKEHLENGALVTLDESTLRLRILPVDRR